MSCSRVQSELSEYLDGDLAGARLQAVTVHLDSCAGCARQLDELRRSPKAVRRMETSQESVRRLHRRTEPV